ncbi:hypothetical protein QL285_080955 [Trifolium repens]|nr:hypothetical protein QL285_080955 [Trifolium repens]
MLAFNYPWILGQLYKLHRTLFCPRIVPICPPENCLSPTILGFSGWSYKHHHTSFKPRNAFRTLEELTSNYLEILGSPTSYKIGSSLHPTISSSLQFKSNYRCSQLLP